MKRNRISESWSRYLEAERSGREEAAEVALLELFSESLERPGPASGFADRVMLQLAPLVPLARRSLVARRAVRLALAASLAVAALPEDRRIVVILRDLEGLAYEEIAEALDLPLNTVRTRLHRARLDLKAKLERWLP